jgi:hypothetical protein
MLLQINEAVSNLCRFYKIYEILCLIVSLYAQDTFFTDSS